MQRPGHSVLAKFADLHARFAPSGRGPAVTVEEIVPWAVGYLGEVQVGERLAGMDGRWRVLHAVPLGVRGKDVDHLLIGPAEIFAINTQHHPGARVTVKGRDALYVNGTWKPYLKDARRDAAAVRDLLTSAGPIDVQAVVCLVDARLTVTTPGEAVHVADVNGLIPWLTGLPEILNGDLVDHVYVRARHADTWAGRPVLAAPDGADALARDLVAQVPTPTGPPTAEPAAARRTPSLPSQRTRRTEPSSGQQAPPTSGFCASQATRPLFLCPTPTRRSRGQPVQERAHPRGPARARARRARPGHCRPAPVGGLRDPPLRHDGLPVVHGYRLGAAAKPIGGAAATCRRTTFPARPRFPRPREAVLTGCLPAKPDICRFPVWRLDGG